MSNKLKLYPVEKFSGIREMLALAEKEAPDTYAFKYKPGEKTASGDPVVVSVTYKEFVNTTRAIGTALYERGYHGGVHVACIGENSYNWVCVYLSTLAGDNVFVPIDKELPLAELLNVLQRSGSTVVFWFIPPAPPDFPRASCCRSITLSAVYTTDFRSPRSTTRDFRYSPTTTPMKLSAHFLFRFTTIRQSALTTA